MVCLKMYKPHESGSGTLPLPRPRSGTTHSRFADREVPAGLEAPEHGLCDLSIFTYIYIYGFRNYPKEKENAGGKSGIQQNTHR